jgi:hypothetical protein
VTDTERLLDLLAGLYAGARDQSWAEAELLGELVTGDPWTAEDVDGERFRAWLAARLSTR